MEPKGCEGFFTDVMTAELSFKLMDFYNIQRDKFDYFEISSR